MNKAQEKLIQRGSKIPVIFVTAFDTQETREQARQGGAVGYFRKPVDDQALLDVVKWALSSQEASKEDNTGKGRFSEEKN